MEAIRCARVEKEGRIWIGAFDPGDRRQKRVDAGKASFVRALFVKRLHETIQQLDERHAVENKRTPLRSSPLFGHPHNWSHIEALMLFCLAVPIQDSQRYPCKSPFSR